jgi:butyryl-CoA dehydrogenase
MLAMAKKMGLFAAGVASQKYMMNLADQQEVMGALADAIIEVYAMESCILRAEKLRAEQALRLTRFYSARAVERVEAAARKVIVNAAEGDALRTQLAILRRLAKYEPVDTIALGRQIAAHLVAAGRYSL